MSIYSADTASSGIYARRLRSDQTSQVWGYVKVRIGADEEVYPFDYRQDEVLGPQELWNLREALKSAVDQNRIRPETVLAIFKTLQNTPPPGKRPFINEYTASYLMSLLKNWMPDAPEVISYL